MRTRLFGAVMAFPAFRSNKTLIETFFRGYFIAAVGNNEWNFIRLLSGCWLFY